MGEVFSLSVCLSCVGRRFSTRAAKLCLHIFMSTFGGCSTQCLDVSIATFGVNFIGCTCGRFLRLINAQLMVKKSSDFTKIPLCFLMRLSISLRYVAYSASPGWYIHWLMVGLCY